MLNQMHKVRGDINHSINFETIKLTDLKFEIATNRVYNRKTAENTICKTFNYGFTKQHLRNMPTTYILVTKETKSTYSMFLIQFT